LSFKFIAIAYGMLGATAATGYMVQGGGGNGAAGKRPTSGYVAEAPKVERVAKLEMPPKPGSMPQVAMVSTSQQEESVVMTAPAATPSAMLLTAPPRQPHRRPSRGRAWPRMLRNQRKSLSKKLRSSWLKSRWRKPLRNLPTNPSIGVEAGAICRSRPI
jgi:hypothetical protein